ncbi:MAG: 8-amino-7-oxononanoate synthase [Lysobacterales bacterium]
MNPSPRPDFAARLRQQQQQRLQSSLQRRLRAAQASRPGHIQFDGRELVDFGSNDYLGLARHPRLIEALIAAARAGVGARSSHLLGGHRDDHEALEQAVADWIGYPRALLFSTGYMAALGTLGAVLDRHDLCVQDKLNHACLLDGARLAGADLRRYTHGDVAAAASLLQAQPQRRALLVSDAVFSMDGDIAPLAELAALAAREQAALMVDEAHGLGVLGPQGRGACAAAGLGVAGVPIWMGTLGKALGGFGAIIAGDDWLIDTLINNARSYVYTTALPPALARAMVTAVELARAADAERAHLGRLIECFRAGASERGWTLLPSPTPIQALVIGDSAAALRCAENLQAAGFHCPAVRPPTVPAGSARLRISLSAAHRIEDVEALLAALGRR